jgi:outer membrane protein assembly factor BamB
LVNGDRFSAERGISGKSRDQAESQMRRMGAWLESLPARDRPDDVANAQSNGEIMKTASRILPVLVGCVVVFCSRDAGAQDWPQWRGPKRDGKAAGFNAPATWPRELTRKWKGTVGDGVATPALVEEKLYVFTRQEGNEITRCLDATTGEEKWQDKYAAEGVRGPASGFSGPRSSPTVADGKVVTLGVHGALSCLDAAGGAVLWRKTDFPGAPPRFFTSCSPIIDKGLCIVQLGSEQKGGIVAYDLASGEERWKWTGDGTAYASPVLLSLEGSSEVVAETAGNIVGLGAADGKLLWQVPFAGQGRAYNAATPIVDGATVIFSGSGRGTRAVKVEKNGETVAARELWSVKDNGVQFNTPVYKDGLVFGISDRDMLFCIDTQNNKTAWTSRSDGERGYGSIIDAGSVLLALTPRGMLHVFEPSDREYKELASYKVADGGTYAYPVISGRRIFIKDQDAVTLWTIE